MEVAMWMTVILREEKTVIAVVIKVLMIGVIR